MSRPLSEVFPFEYQGGGYFRRKGVAEGETADTLHGQQAIEYVYNEMTKPMQESGQRVIIGEGPTAGKPISAVCVGEASRETPFCAIPAIRWRDAGSTFVLETWFDGEWLEVPLVTTTKANASC